MKIVYNGELDSKTIKEVSGSTVIKLCEERPEVFYLDADLMSCIGTVAWGKQHPETAVDVGIAEANLVGVAAGMAAEGFKPIIHSFGPFISRRAFDQAFLSAGYAKNSMTILGSDPGVTAEYNGGTHMPFEDVALYREIPDSIVIDISDAAMFEDVLTQCIDIPGVKYLRFGRKTYPRIYEEGSHFEIGKAIELKPGKVLTIFVSGILVHEAMQAAEVLKNEGIDAAVVNIFTIKPIDIKAVSEYAKKTGAVLTVENHNYIGGLYSAVTDVLAKYCPVPADYVAVEDRFGEVGEIEYLQEVFGLTKENIVDKSIKLVKRKG